MATKSYVRISKLWPLCAVIGVIGILSSEQYNKSMLQTVLGYLSITALVSLFAIALVESFRDSSYVWTVRKTIHGKRVRLARFRGILIISALLVSTFTLPGNIVLAWVTRIVSLIFLVVYTLVWITDIPKHLTKADKPAPPDTTRIN